MDDLQQLLTRIDISEDFLKRAEQFFKEKNPMWSDGLTAQFEIFLERKREQVCSERDRAARMGWNFALGHWPPRMDI